MGEAAQEAGRKALDAAGALASEASEQVQQVVHRQVRGAADLVAEVADSVRVAARRLDETMPQAALLTRSAARRIEDLSESVRGQSAAELLQATSAFARRRPAVVFGATAAMGFLMLRLLNAAPPADTEDDEDDDTADFERRGERPQADRNAGAGAQASGEAQSEPAGDDDATPAGGQGEGSDTSGAAGQSGRKPGKNKAGSRGGAQVRNS